MRTVCNRGDGGSKQLGKIVYVINGRPPTVSCFYLQLWNHLPSWKTDG